MAPDPYARYLQQADELFASGEVVRAGQIWQAVLKAVPDHGPAREGLLRVKAALERKQAEEAAAIHRRATDSSVEIPALPEPTRATVAMPLPAVPVPEPAPAPEPEPEPMVAELAPDPVPAAEPLVVEAPPAPVQAPAPMDDDTQEKLLREGCTLYDMGQVEDALRKWNQLLAAVPDHAMALQYAEGARQELGLPLDGSVAPAASASHPVTQEIPIYGADEEAADKLLREGCLLYDMGLPEEAIGKWDQALKLAPHRSDIQSFLDNAHKDVAEAAAAPAPSPAAPAPGPSAADEKARQAEHLMGMQRFEEAAFTYQQALDLDPNHPQAKAGLLRARAAQGSPMRPSSTSQSGPIRIEMDRPDPVPEAPAPAAGPEPVQPPSALTKPAPAPRTGLQIKAPEGFDASKLPDWVKNPMAWAGAAGGVLVVVLGAVFYKNHARDSQLAADVAAAHRAAVAKAARDAQVPDLRETDASILSEGQQALGDGDAVRAYLRAQTLLKKNASNGAAAQLLDQAKASLPQAGLVGATAEEFHRHLQEGDLDNAAKVMDALLRANPDDPVLRGQALHLYLRLAEDHASQGRWSDAQTDLLRGRALGPDDPAWSARLALLPKIQGLSKGDQALWIAMLG